ncbi:MAG: glycosyltransferase, partial [Thermoplasmata archaeon]|nr:glycosyltransferase [Thermoplasmata archaeon]
MKTLLIALYPYQGKSLDSWHDHGAGMTVAAALAAGCQIDFFDMKRADNDEKLIMCIKGYDLIAFGLKSSYYPIGMKLIKMAKDQGSKVMVGGYHATAAPNELIENPDIDYIFHGESEITFPKFLADPSSFDREIFGEKPQNLDDLPFFNREIYQSPIEDCAGWWYGGKLTKMISVVSARGCPYKCGFCQPIEDNHFGKKLRRRSVDSIISELKWLKKLYNPECVMIHDDTFLIQPDWIEEFIEKYPQIGLPFWASGRADGICKYPDLVNRLVKVGWDLVSVGFESGSQKILDKMNKGTTVEQNLEAARIIHSTKAKIYANYIIGLPWETKEDIQATACMADIIKAEMPSWAYFTPYPGCEMGEECIADGLSLLDRNHYDRCPHGRKVQGVNYTYAKAVIKGFRGDEEMPDQSQCDIIIPTYKNEDLTVACLNSIKKYTTSIDYRVIWVDNASGETSKVEEAIRGMHHLRIDMPTNEGFVNAVNRGIKASNSSFICLLNNDTVVSDRWLEKLINVLNKYPKLGIVGPMTLPIKGDRVYDSQHNLSLHPQLFPSTSKLSLEDTNKVLEFYHHEQLIDISFVAFLCAVIKVEVINKVGLLDTNYHLGMWDDNDYCIATRRFKYEVKLLTDTCIQHKGRSTFIILQDNEGVNLTELMAENKAYLDKKWGIGKAQRIFIPPTIPLTIPLTIS